MRKDRWIGGLLFVGVIAAVVVGQWRIRARRETTPIVVLQRPRAVMGTACSMAAVVMDRDRALAEEALRQAESELRSIEARMSSWLADSEISQLNAAEAGRWMPLAPDTLDVLRAARASAVETQGAFDVTCGPLVRLWQQAGRSGVLPTDSAVERARAASNWSLFELRETGARKLSADARLDLGGITKGYAIDRAVGVLRRAGLVGGMVDVGGDLRCFGRQVTSELWPVDVQNPFGAGHLVELKIPGRAVATSGNYARFAEIQGRRYSHIIDPRSGRPTQAAAGVTVIAPEAMTADVWATALSVLGPEGFAALPEGVEAMIVTGDEHDFQLHATAGFRELMVEPVPQGIKVWNGDTRPQ
jgi:thiamine biosynthesis lipoprotein